MNVMIEVVFENKMKVGDIFQRDVLELQLVLYNYDDGIQQTPLCAFDIGYVLLKRTC